MQSGDAPRDRPRSTGKTPKVEPLIVHPKLTAGRYVFPVYGPVSYSDTFGAARPTSPTTTATTSSASSASRSSPSPTGRSSPSAGTRSAATGSGSLDGQGNQFYYAHLSAFSTAAVNGARVKAGEVVGFMGHTGDAEGTPYHLHFEVHPVSLLYLGYDGAVDPTPYLDAWQPPAGPPVPGRERLGARDPGRAGRAGARRDPARDVRHLDGRRARPGVARSAR